jgi:glycosyltransferase involved in cell wall biosynthesis
MVRKYYTFFANRFSLQPDSAHEIHDVLCANAAANLGYATVLTYPDKRRGAFNPLTWLSPFQPQLPEKTFAEFYGVQEQLKIARMPLPWLVNQAGGKWTNISTLVCKYYLPVHLRPVTQIVHTRDWNFAKAAVKLEIPVIFEHHYFQNKQFESEIVNSPFFQVAITQSKLTRQSFIEQGMPPEKAIALHNGFEQLFLNRQPEEAEAWRQVLLKDGRQHLVVYSGALYRFKGVDLLIDVAKELPEVQFVLTGGTETQVEAYQQQAADKQVENITFLGWILPRERLVSLFQAADVLAHPHCSGKEADFTNPVKFFQYIASGTPIVVTEIPPLLEFQHPNLAMSWCEPDCPIAFAQCLEAALDRYPRKVEGYTENIAFGQQFSWENRIAKIISYVDDSLKPLVIQL